MGAITILKQQRTPYGTLRLGSVVKTKSPINLNKD